ncbi:MBL fold metallo-hydrolase [Nocardioides sp. C4-1]|uniref:MBL fold metallo-hydrolase n=1 Tax=Nocardioides sp. C4-1 TaxID=3151851 RepID=UPI00326574A1
MHLLTNYSVGGHMIIWGQRYRDSEPHAGSPVWPGESWIWAADEMRARVVVDVGCAPELGRRAAQAQPDILVLTHDDSDHIGGMWAFLAEYAEHPERAVPEVWMPVEWLFIVQAIAATGLDPQVLKELAATDAPRARSAAQSAAADIGAASQGRDPMNLRIEEHSQRSTEWDAVATPPTAEPLPESVVDGLKVAIPDLADVLENLPGKSPRRRRTAIVEATKVLGEAITKSGLGPAVERLLRDHRDAIETGSRSVVADDGQLPVLQVPPTEQELMLAEARQTANEPWERDDLEDEFDPSPEDPGPDRSDSEDFLDPHDSGIPQGNAAQDGDPSGPGCPCGDCDAPTSADAHLGSKGNTYSDGSDLTFASLGLAEDDDSSLDPHDVKKVGERAAESARRVVALVWQAHALGFRFRWFDVDRARYAGEPRWHESGLPGTCTIVSAEQVMATDLPEPQQALAVLARASYLTIQNDRALVTFLWPSAGPAIKDVADFLVAVWMRAPLGARRAGTRWSRREVEALVRDKTSAQVNDGVIIWSDSSAKLLDRWPAVPYVPWPLIGLMSAPHHASTDDVNTEIWRARPFQVRVMLSANKHRDHEKFFEVFPTHRGCTKCGIHGSPFFAVSVPPEDVEIVQPCTHRHVYRLFTVEGVGLGRERPARR